MKHDETSWIHKNMYSIHGTKLEDSLLSAFLGCREEEFYSLLEQGANLNVEIIRKGQYSGNIFQMLVTLEPEGYEPISSFKPMVTHPVDEEARLKQEKKLAREKAERIKLVDDKNSKRSDEIIKMVNAWLNCGGSDEINYFDIKYFKVRDYVFRSQLINRMLKCSGIFNLSDENSYLDYINKCAEYRESNLTIQEILTDIVKTNSRNESLIAEVLEDERKFALSQIQIDKEAIKALPKILCKDKEFMLRASAIDKNILKYAYYLYGDKDFMLKAVAIDYDIIRYAYVFYGDKDFMLKAASVSKQPAWTLSFALKDLKKDKLFLYQVWKKYPKTFYLSGYRLSDDLKTLEMFKNKQIKLEDIPNSYFVEDYFFEEITNIVQNRTLSYFEELTSNCSEEDIVDASITDEINKKIASFNAKIQAKRNLAIQENEKILKRRERIDNIKQAIQDFEV